MSRYPDNEPVTRADIDIDSLDTVIVPRVRDLGDFEVRRILPAAERRMVGPFIFFDHMGPTVFEAGHAVDVRPHPHIGLATVTWLAEGEIMHRDSLGTEQLIAPGAVNWMIAGSGIAHSERTPENRRGGGAPLHGIQTWVALPKEHEEIDPSFAHFPAADLPSMEGEGARVVMIAGEGWGLKSPVPVLSDTLYAEVTLSAGAEIALPRQVEERGLYLLSGGVSVAGRSFEPGSLLVFKSSADVRLLASADTRMIAVGGAAMDGPRHIWWNFVSSSRERIDAAKADWKAGRFAKVPGDETEFIPLPES